MHIDLSLDSPRAAVCLGRFTVCLVLLRAWQSDGNCCAELPLGCCLLKIPRIPVVHMLRNCTVCGNSLSEMCYTVDLHMQSMLMCENVIFSVCAWTTCTARAQRVRFPLEALHLSCLHWEIWVQIRACLIQLAFGSSRLLRENCVLWAHTYAGPPAWGMAIAGS